MRGFFIIALLLVGSTAQAQVEAFGGATSACAHYVNGYSNKGHTTLAGCAALAAVYDLTIFDTTSFGDRVRFRGTQYPTWYYQWIYPTSGPMCPADHELGSDGMCHSTAPSCPADAPPVFKVTSGIQTIQAIDFLACRQDCSFRYSSSYFSDSNTHLVYEPMGTPCTGNENGDLDGDAEGVAPAELPDGESQCHYVGELLKCADNSGGIGGCYDSAGNSIPCPPQASSGDGQTPDEPGEKCGFYGGEYRCFDDGWGGNGDCGFVGGDLVCVPAGGTGPIGQDDPDHPKNGGNNDGRSDNDVFDDESDVQTNGLSSDEIRRAIQQAIAEGRFAGGQDGTGTDMTGVIEAIGEQTGVLEEAFGESSEEFPDGMGIIEGAYDDYLGTFDLVGSGAYGVDRGEITGPLDSIGQTAMGALPSGGSCGAYPFDLHFVALEVDTCRLNIYRTVMEWGLYAFTIGALFAMATGRSNKEAD